jgi:Pyridoxamine 5'-phosphate oxidase
MESRNLAELYDLPTLDWQVLVDRLDAGFTQVPGTDGPDRHTCWLATIDADGRPHVTGIGAMWHDGAFWFETGKTTRKSRNSIGPAATRPAPASAWPRKRRREVCLSRSWRSAIVSRWRCRSGSVPKGVATRGLTSDPRRRFLSLHRRFAQTSPTPRRRFMLRLSAAILRAVG